MTKTTSDDHTPQEMDPSTTNGSFKRKESLFRNWITVDGQPGPGGTGGFPAAQGRYHLYVSYACPWAHRTLIIRKLKKLEDIITVSVVHPDMPQESWKFAEYPGATPDHINDFEYLYQAYELANPGYEGIVTVPTLWDKQKQTIVNNESSEIIRMFNSAFGDFTDVDIDYYPQDLRPEIDEINEKIYKEINNGVYRCGFAKTQQAYERSFDRLFAALDELEQRLAGQRYLISSQITEADWRLFPTLIRFDPVYVGHFKCNLRRIADYPNLSNYLRDLYQQPGIAQTVNMDHIKRHYYYSHDAINPTQIVPKGPLVDYTLAHDRDRFT